MGGVLSGGEQQMLTIARTLMGNPELLLLDEPSEGLAPVIVENLLAQVQRLKGEGLTILLAEQGVDFSLSLADRVYVLEKGAVRFSGAAAQLRDDADSASQAARTLSPQHKEETAMPFVNIRILKGHPQERKDEIARRVTETIAEVAKLPKEAVWVVFEDVTADDWYVGQSRVSELQKKAASGGEVVSGVEIRDERFEGVVGNSVQFERLATGFVFTEGPLWHRRDKYLLFSDMPGDHLRRWSQKDGVTTFRKPCNKSNGLTWDLQGRLIVCEHASSHLTRTEPDGKITVLASHHAGKELNSPNDVIVRSDGAIYFSDPTYGRKPHFGLPREPELSFRGVYRLTPDGKTLTLLADDFGQPNGLCFSLDEKVLFVNDTDSQHIRAFDVNADGTLANSRVWAKTAGEGRARPTA